MNGERKDNREGTNLLSWKSALSQIIAVSVKNVVLVGYGMTLGFPTLLIPVLSSRDNDEPFYLGQEGISWIGSIGLICVPFGCFTSGMLTQPFGRKRSMQFINIPFVAAWMLFYFSSEIWHIFAALAVTGLAGGLMEAPVLTYVAEITQPHLRGVLSSTSSMSVIGGAMTQFILATFLKWRTVAACSAMVPIVSFFLLFFIPETPIWLVTKKRYREAKESLAWLRGWVSVDEVDTEYQDLFKHIQTSRGIGNSQFQNDMGQIEAEGNGHVKFDKTDEQHVPITKRSRMDTLRLFQKRNFIRPYLLVTYIFFLSHFSGLSAVQTYAVNIFTSLRAPIDKYYATALLGIVEMLGCITCVSLVHYVGKRVLAFISLCGTSLCFLLVGYYSFEFNILYLLKFSNSSTNSTNLTVISADATDSYIDSYSWVPLVVIILGAFVSHMGIRVLPWILTGEIFPNETRAVASGIAATSFYIFGFICNKVFLSMVASFTLPGTFWFYSTMSLIGVIILYFQLPETEGKTLQDITDHFAGKTVLGNNVQKGKKNIVRLNNNNFDKGLQKDSPVESKL